MQSMKFHISPVLTLPISITTVLTLAIASVIAPAPARASSFDTYKQECLQRVRTQGLTQEVALDVCNCTIKKFQSTYSLAQFQALVKKSKTDTAAARRLAEVGETCFESVLYEN